MITENLSTLKIHKLTQAQYDRELENGNIDENALYLTPDEEIDLSPYATVEQLNEKADATHTHEIDDINNLQLSLDEKVSTSRTINGKALTNNITLSATDVGADASGSADDALASAKEYADTISDAKSDVGHTHNDIYYTESEIDTKVSEINATITDIVNGNTMVANSSHATSSDSANNATLSEKSIQDNDGNIITDTYETKSDATSKLNEAKTYADGIKNDLLNGAGDAYDTLKELGELIDTNTDAIVALETIATGKADKEHTHTVADVTNLQVELDKKQNTVIGGASTITSNNLTVNRALVSDDSGKVAVSNVTSTELNYLDGVTSDIQTQLDAKANSSHEHSADNITSGELSVDRLPTIPITNGGTGATDSAAALTNLGAMSATNPTGTGSLSINRKANSVVGSSSVAIGYHTTASGSCSHAEGENTIASNLSSHAEGNMTTASGSCSHAEGALTTANGDGSHAEGNLTTASGFCSHAEGEGSVASGDYSHAEGGGTTASGYCSHAGGYYTTALDYQHTSGKYNAEKTCPSSADTQDTTYADAIFMVGCGTSTATKNAFRVSSGGKCFGATAFGATGADFAELIEWFDGNPNKEDRRGLFVALDGDKIKLANTDDDYIGVISSDEAFLGNAASEEWQGKYLTDVFGTKLTQEVEVPEKIDEVTGEIIVPAHTTTQYVLNPDYNSDEDYVMRENRKEWGKVGLVGQIVVVDDGTCVTGGYVKPSVNGIGTASDNGYRVMKRIDETHIKVLVK